MSSEVWSSIIKDQITQTKEALDLVLNIQEAMRSYLIDLCENKEDIEKFTIHYDASGTVTIDCLGDLFNLEHIGDFSEAFNLEILFNHRLIVENYMENTTNVKTRFILMSNENKKNKEEKGEEEE